MAHALAPSTSGKFHVSWVPWSPDHFVVGSTALHIFKWNKDTADVEFMRTEHDVKRVECLAWNSYGSNRLLAVGLGDGRTLVTDTASSLGDGGESSSGILCELITRPPRIVTCIGWHPTLSNLLAVGYQKQQRQPGVCIFNISEGDSGVDANALNKHVSGSAPTFPDLLSGGVGNRGATSAEPFSRKSGQSQALTKAIEAPIFELASNEGVVDISWAPLSPSCLVVGTSAKWLRVYDLRTPNPSTAVRSMSAHTRQVYGVKFDPHMPFRLLTHGAEEGGTIKVWDIRHDRDPMSVLHTRQKNLIQVDWCEAVPGVISCLSAGPTDFPLKMWYSVNKSEVAGGAASRSGAAPREEEQSYSVPSYFKHSVCREYANSELNTFSVRESVMDSGEDAFLSCLSWHSSQRYLAATVSKGGVVNVMKLRNSIPFTWSPTGQLSTSTGSGVVALKPTTPIDEQADRGDKAAASTSGKSQLVAFDMTRVMWKRSLLGYSMQVEDNIALLKDHQRYPYSDRDQLLHLFEWMKHVEEMNIARSRKTLDRFDWPSVVDIMEADTSGRRVPLPFESMTSGSAPAVDADEEAVAAMHESLLSLVGDRIDARLLEKYKPEDSPGRRLVMEICGWIKPGTTVSQQVKSIADSGNVPRAFALATFFHSRSLAADVLVRVLKDPHRLPPHERERYQTLAVLLSTSLHPGEETTSTLMYEVLSLLRTSMEDPYIRAALLLLASPDDDPNIVYSHVLRGPIFSREAPNIGNATGAQSMDLRDRIAFAARFMPNEDLMKFLSSTTDSYVIAAKLEGIYLTGLTRRGLILLQSYVVHTGDVQTAALVVSHVVPRKFASARAQMWQEMYGNLLDHWQMWSQRVRFDMDMDGMGRAVDRRIPAAVSLRCLFCQQPLVGDSAGSMGSKASGYGAPPGQRGYGGHRRLAHQMSPSARGGNSAVGQKGTACPHCQKALPRCSVCLMSMGTASIPNTDEPGEVSTAKNKAGMAALWFVWCMQCGHGGHPMHIEEWFSNHDDCPVAGCTCKCSSLDS